MYLLCYVVLVCRGCSLVLFFFFFFKPPSGESLLRLAACRRLTDINQSTDEVSCFNLLTRRPGKWIFSTLMIKLCCLCTLTTLICWHCYFFFFLQRTVHAAVTGEAYECLVMPWRSFSFFNPGQSAIFSFLSFFSPVKLSSQFFFFFFLTLGQDWLRMAGNGGDRDRKHLPGKQGLKSWISHIKIDKMTKLFIDVECKDWLLLQITCKSS